MLIEIIVTQKHPKNGVFQFFPTTNQYLFKNRSFGGLAMVRKFCSLGSYPQKNAPWKQGVLGEEMMEKAPFSAG